MYNRRQGRKAARLDFACIGIPCILMGAAIAAAVTFCLSVFIHGSDLARILLGVLLAVIGTLVVREFLLNRYGAIEDPPLSHNIARHPSETAFTSSPESATPTFPANYTLLPQEPSAPPYQATLSRDWSLPLDMPPPYDALMQEENRK